MSQYWGYKPGGLDNNLNWDLLFRGERRSSVAPNTGAHIPIQPISLPTSSYVVLVGTKCNDAKPSWYRGGYASMRLFVTPSVTSEFTASVDAAQQLCRLNNLTLISWPRVLPVPYLLYIEAPRYFRHWFVEIWEFSGSYDDLHTLTP